MARFDDRRSLVAAVKSVTPSEVASFRIDTTGRSFWEYYKKIPDVRYIANLSGRLLSLSEPQLETYTETGEWVVVDDIFATAALDSLYESTGGLEDICRRFGQNYVVDGQCFFVGYNNKMGVNIEVLSTRELSSEGQKYQRRAAIGFTPTYLPRGTKVSRVWRRHPEYSDLAETPLEALIDDMDTLIFLNQALRARVRSRLASSGVVFLPNSLVSVSDAQRPDGSDLPVDQVTRDLLEAMANAVDNPDSPDAAMPIVLRGPDEAGERIKHIVFDRTIDETEMSLRRELRKNILIAMDAPQEIADGIGSASSFNASSIQMQMWEHTVAPIGDVMWEALTRMMLRPWLEKNGVEGRYRWRVNRDSVQIRNNEDEKTRSALDRGLISDAVARRKLGFSESDAPTTEEFVRWFGVQSRLPELAFYDLDVDPAVYGGLVSPYSNPEAAAIGDGRDLPGDTPNDEPQEQDKRIR